MVRPAKYKEIKNLKIPKRVSAKENYKVKIEDSRILKILDTTIKKNSSGGYISTSGKFVTHKAYIIIME